ncbi:hypothetical protein C8J57DRAFT_100234 [Mycena rebaudengoi]|nr:hypothetical protein C8J57DRAFT_100234 [Mycena rebaudengoi]
MRTSAPARPSTARAPRTAPTSTPRYTLTRRVITTYSIVLPFFLGGDCVLPAAVVQARLSTLDAVHAVHMLVGSTPLGSFHMLMRAPPAHHPTVYCCINISVRIRIPLPIPLPLLLFFFVQLLFPFFLCAISNPPFTYYDSASCFFTHCWRFFLPSSCTLFFGGSSPDTAPSPLKTYTTTTTYCAGLPTYKGRSCLLYSFTFQPLFLR